MYPDPNRCSKCQKDGHGTRGCLLPWPPHEKQECDACGDIAHEVKRCPKFDSNLQYCTKCGHYFHRVQACPIKDDSIASNLEQYTKSKYEAVMNARGSGNNRRQFSTPGPSPSGQNTRALPARPAVKGLSKHAGRAGGSNTQAATSDQQALQDVPDPADQLETNLQITVNNNAKRKPLEKKELDRLRWAKVKFNEVLEQPGRPIWRNQTVQANFLTFGSPTTPNVVLHKYRIQLGTITRGQTVQTITKPETKRILIKKLLQVQRPPTGAFVTDFLEFIISVGPLYPQFSSPVPCAYAVPHLRSTPAGLAPDTMNTIFWFEGTMDTDRLLNYFNYRSNLAAANLGTYHPDQDMRNLNVLSWHHINNDNTFRGGRSGNKFYAGGFGVGPEGNFLTDLYIVQKGYFSSVRPGRDSLLLNVNPVTTAFFQPIPLQNWINFRWPNAAHLPLPHSIDWKELKDVRVIFEGHLLDTNGRIKPRAINSFLFGAEQPPSFRPKDANGNLLPLTTVLAYLRRTYSTLNFPANICWVNCGSTAQPNWFPANYLRIIEWQKVKGQVATSATATMLARAQTHSSQNKRYIFAASEALGVSPPAGWQMPGPGYQSTPRLPAPAPVSRLTSRLSNNPGRQSWPPFYSTFGFNPQWGILQIPVRYLTQPELTFMQPNNNQDQRLVLATSSPLGQRASWNLVRRHFLSRPAAPFRLCVLRIDLDDEPCLENFRKQFNEYLNGCRIRTQGTPMDRLVRTNDNNRNTFHANLTAAYDALLNRSNQDGTGSLPLLVVVLRDKGDPTTYAYLKWWGDCFRGVRTVCVTRNAVNTQHRHGNIDPGFMGNLSLKVNFKLGGTSHALANDRQWYGAKPQTMIVGADVTHPGRSANPTYPSMAGVVATRDATSAHYLGSARLQAKNTEHIAELDDMMEERICVYFQRGGRLPQHILFYRDGVSESQFGMVHDDELPLIRQGCSRAGIRCGTPNWAPHITLLVVGKRHHARFYPLNPGPPRSTTANPPSGLVVDRIVTSPWKADFYLQSHDSALGTAKSAHYIIVVNESNYFMDEIQELTNKLCYTGQRATKALSVCTPAKYADILCDRLRCYVKGVFPHTAPNAGAAPFNLGQYNFNPNAWGANRPPGAPVAATAGPAGLRRVNPWHPNVDEVMFYL